MAGPGELGNWTYLGGQVRYGLRQVLECDIIWQGIKRKFVRLNQCCGFVGRKGVIRINQQRRC